MALNQEFFDSIQIDVVKRKYYNANKVNAVFDEIRLQAQELMDENESLRAALSTRDQEYENTRNKLLAVQEVYRETLDKAHERADAVLREAKKKAESITAEAEEKNARAERLVKDCFERIRRMEEDNLKYLNSQLQSFLQELGADGPRRISDESRHAAAEQREDADSVESLEQKISLLAKEIRELETN